MRRTPLIPVFFTKNLLNIVLELPPAPAALVLLGRWFAVFSARSAAAFLRITVAGPPGGLGEVVRPVDVPEGVLTGEVGRGADYCATVSNWPKASGDYAGDVERTSGAWVGGVEASMSRCSWRMQLEHECQ